MSGRIGQPPLQRRADGRRRSPRLLFVQILLGALVAGMKAGMGYNTWPLMDGQLIPNGLGIMQPWYLNLFENAMTVQFNHRVAAYVVMLAVAWHTWSVLRVSGDARVRGTAVALAAGTLLQAVLGIWTLLAQVPLSLGLAHQAGAAALFALAVWHLYAVRHARVVSGGAHKDVRSPAKS